MSVLIQVDGFQSIPIQQQRPQSLVPREQRISSPSALSFYWNDSNNNHHQRRHNQPYQQTRRQKPRIVVTTSIIGINNNIMERGGSTPVGRKRHSNLDMVSKFVEVELPLSVYMEAGIHQFLASVQAQAITRKILARQQQQQTSSKTRIHVQTEPLYISLIETDNPIQSLSRRMILNEPGIHFVRGKTWLTCKVASMDYFNPKDMIPSKIQQQDAHFGTKPNASPWVKAAKPMYQSMSLELIGDLSVKNPAFVNVLPTNSAGSTAAAGISSRRRSKSSKLQLASSSADRVWITSFSLTEQNGRIQSLDSTTGRSRSVSTKTSESMVWPNESNSVPTVLHGETEEDCKTFHDALLVSDGFLVPGKNNGGLYVVKNPTNPIDEETICLTGGKASDESWFYHKSVWVDLTGDGRKSILTARAQMMGPFGNKTARTQLVWLEMPKAPLVMLVDNSSDQSSTVALDEDKSIFDPFHSRHLPWKAHVLDEGPDVMFAVADLDSADDTVEVISSEFFDRVLSIRSIQKGPSPKVVFRRVIDDQCGAPFSVILADLDAGKEECDSYDSIVADSSTDDGCVADSTKRSVFPRVVDSGSTVSTTQCGDRFSHILITSQPCKGRQASGEYGGALFAYRVPTCGNWKTEPWIRTTVASGFHVRTNLWNMINPGAPGFVYTFHPQKAHNDLECHGNKRGRKRPMIAIAGDCSESAYILQPIEYSTANKCSRGPVEPFDDSTCYKLVCEIETGATVGSIGIGYGSFGKSPAGIAKLYLPLFEKNKMLVFALSGAVETVV